MPTCVRCKGTRFVPINVADFPDEPDWTDRECPDCGGTGQRPLTEFELDLMDEDPPPTPTGSGRP